MKLSGDLKGTGVLEVEHGLAIIHKSGIPAVILATGTLILLIAGVGVLAFYPESTFGVRPWFGAIPGVFLWACLWPRRSCRYKVSNKTYRAAFGGADLTRDQLRETNVMSPEELRELPNLLLDPELDPELVQVRTELQNLLGPLWVAATPQEQALMVLDAKRVSFVKRNPGPRSLRIEEASDEIVVGFASVRDAATCFLTFAADNE